jgi:hypothetical protein
VCWCRIYVDDLADSVGKREIPMVYSPVSQGSDSGPDRDAAQAAAAVAAAQPATAV